MVRRRFDRLRKCSLSCKTPFVKSPSTRKRPKRVALLGLPVLRSQSPFNAALIRYAEEQSLWRFLFSGEANVKTFRFLRELECDGAIVRIITPEMRKEALRVGFPIVNISGWLEDAGVPSVRSDEEALGRLCAEHLLARGFRRFGAVRLRTGWFSKARMAGFRKSIEAAGCEENVSSFEQHSSTIDLSSDEIIRFGAWLSTLKSPVGLFLTDDESAAQLLDAIRAEGLRIPQDVAVIAAFRHVESLELCEPPLTHVDYGEDIVALEAARCLDRLMNGEAPVQRTLYVAPRGVVARRSTDTLAVDNPMAAKAVEFIREHSCENINVKVISERLSVCRRTLDDHFTRAMGLSMHQFLLRQRITHAHDLLRTEPALSLREIASRCGFFDARHMKRVLKRDGFRPSVGWRAPKK